MNALMRGSFRSAAAGLTVAALGGWPILPAAAQPIQIATLGRAPLMGTSTSVAELRYNVRRHEALLQRAGTLLGLTAAQYEQFRSSLETGDSAWVTVPRHLDAMTWWYHGRVRVLRDVVIPAQQKGVEVDLRAGDALVAVFLPSTCGNLSVIRRHAPHVAAANDRRVSQGAVVMAAPSPPQPPVPAIPSVDVAGFVVAAAPPPQEPVSAIPPEPHPMVAAAAAPPPPPGTATSRSRGGRRRARASAPGALPAVQANAYDTFNANRPERPDFGRYTYVLLTKTDTERNLSLLTALTQRVTQVKAELAEIDKSKLNLYEIPVTAEAPSDSSDPATLLASYDWGEANALISKACAHPGLCNVDHQGPYLITYAQPLHPGAVGPVPYLIADLRSINARVYRRIVAEMNVAEEKAIASSSDVVRINSLQTRLASMVFDAASATTPVATLFHVFPGGK